MMDGVIQTLVLAMTPIGELRAAIPMGLTYYKLGIVETYLISVIGNMIPVVAIAYLLEPVSKWLSKHSKYFHSFFNWLFERTRKKNSKKFEVFEDLALITFVAIPLPMTGAWSGILAAFVFGIPPKKAIPLVGLGVTIAGVIVTLITLGIKLFV